MGSWARSEFEGAAEIHCFGYIWWLDRAHLWNYDAKIDHVRGQSSKAAPRFKVLAVEVIAWPRTSLKLWCKMGSCARSGFEGNVETDVLALEVMAGPRTSLKLWCKMWSCARLEFGGNTEILYSGTGGIMKVALPLCMNSYDFQWVCIDLALELMVLPCTSLILWCAVRVWRQCWNSIFWPWRVSWGFHGRFAWFLMISSWFALIWP